MFFRFKNLLKFFSKIFVIFLVFIWIFSGWPVVWKNPRIPPEIKEAYGATNVKVGTFTKITTTGNQSITGLGFQPKAIIFFWSRNTTNAAAAAPRSQGIGFTDCTNQRVVAIAEDDNAGTSNAGRYRSESNVIVILSNGNPTVESRASFVSCNADGFTINWVVSGATAHIINYIALGGPDITNVKAGTFTLTNTTGNQSVTGLSFRPEFLMFLWSFTEAVDTASAGLEMGFGFADAFGNQGSIVNVVQDGQANNSTKYSQQRTDQVILLTNLTGAQDALANFVSMDSDGFTINKSDAPAANTPIFYLAIRGGSHKVGNFLQPTATGIQSITGVGFQPQGLVLFSRNQAAGTTLTAPATISFGAGGQATTSRAVVWGQSRNVDPSNAAVYTDNTKIMVMRTLSGTGGAGTINAQADLQSFDANGFSLNWTSADTTQRQIIYWVIGNSPTFTQSAYRFFNNLDSTDVGTPLANQDTPATLSSSGQAFRLRLLIHVGNGNLALYGQSFKLQFGTSSGGNCSTSPPSSWSDVTTSTAIAYNNNPTPADGAALTANANDPTHGSDTIVNQTYEEANNFTNSIAAINSGQDGKWDFSLRDTGVSSNATYCFRVVKADGTLLNTYSVIPQINIISNQPPTIDKINIEPSPIDLVANSTKTVTITATISDPDGCEDVFSNGSITGVFYDDAVENDNCTADDNDCYPNLTFTEVDNTCSGTGDKDGDAQATVNIWFIANASTHWIAKITVTDSQSHSTSSTQDVTINELIAFNLDVSSINYGVVNPNQVSEERQVLITTTGNVAIDVKLSGTDLTWSSYSIPVSQQKYSSTPGFNWETQGTPLTTTPTCHELSTGKPTQHPSNQSEYIYWKLKVPLDKPAQTYSGRNTFNVVSDSACP